MINILIAPDAAAGLHLLDKGDVFGLLLQITSVSMNQRAWTFLHAVYESHSGVCSLPSKEYSS